MFLVSLRRRKRPGRSLLVQGQDAPLQIVQILLPAADAHYVGQIPTSASPVAAMLAKAAAAGAALTDEDNAEANVAFPPRLQQSERLISAAVVTSEHSPHDAVAVHPPASVVPVVSLLEDKGSAEGGESHQIEDGASAAVEGSQQGALAPAIVQAVGAALVDPVASSVAAAMGAGLHSVLHEHLAASLPASLNDVLNATVTVGIERGVHAAVAASLSDVFSDALARQLPDPVFQATTTATARLVTAAVTHAVALGVLQSILDRSLAEQQCEKCNAAGRDCHACDATKEWFRHAADVATLHADIFGAYYGEYWAEVFLADSTDGVRNHVKNA
jgi:hypothetical protein